MSINQTLYNVMPVPAQNALVSAYGYYLKHKRQGGTIAQIRELITASRGWSIDQVRQHQNRRLLAILQRCAHEVPYYADLFQSLGIRATEFNGLDDLACIPVLSKETVRRNGPSLMARGFRPYWTQHTSGSTGTPVVVHVNRHTFQLVHALLEQHEADCGIGPCDLRATFAGRMVQPAEILKPPFWRYNHAQRQILFSAYHLTEETIQYYVDELARRQPAEIIGYPSAISTVAAHINRAGQEGKVTPRVVITNSETLFAWQRRAIERAFGCPVRDYYGSAEAVVFAAQCEAGAYHFNPLLGIAEIVDDEGKPVRGGDSGRLVCTTLTNDTMPLVRYEVGDAAASLDAACPCGSLFPGVREIVGRQDDTILTPDGRAVGRIDHIFKGVSGIKECQVVQEALDLVRLMIVVDGDFDRDQEQLLRENARLRLGGAMRIEFCRVSTIPRTRAGKFRGVVSRLTGTREVLPKQPHSAALLDR
jgi:phenylacetate-CoA ligase